MDENDINKYQRSKSSNNFNELARTFHKFSSINFNLMNSLSNNKKWKYSVESKNIQKNNDSKSNDIHKIYENKNMAEKCLSYNNLVNNRVNFNELNNTLSLDNNNDNILVTYIQNNNINFNTNNNIMSIHLKEEDSNKNLLYKEIKENKTQRNSSYFNNKLINRHKPMGFNNAFRNKNVLYKKRMKDKNIINNESKKENVKNKKIKKIKNNDCNYYKKNFNKNIPISKINEFKNKTKINTIVNNNNFDSINDKNYMEINMHNDFNYNKKVRSQTLNGHPGSNHRLYNKFEENKNSTMEISKNIKKKFYNNYLKDVNNYNDNSIKYNNNIKNKNSVINYNSNKKKNNKTILNRKNELNNEINLLNGFMKDFNREQKEISYLFNYQNISKELNTQRLPRMGNRKKSVNSLINYNSDKFINSKIKNKLAYQQKERQKDKNISKNEFINNKNYENYFDKDNFYTNFYKRKSKAYVISKEMDNNIMKRMKNINSDDYYSNDINYDNINDDSDSIKNIKFLSLQKEKINDKNEKMNKKKKFSNNEGLNNNKNNKRKLNYYYGVKKNMKDFLGNSRTINN